MNINQKVMEALYPEWSKYPQNVMIPKVFYYSDNSEEPIAVTFLILGSEFMIEGFRIEPPGNKTNIIEEISLAKNENSMGKDLVISFEFLFDGGNPIFKAIVYGDDPIKQKEFCEALLRVKKFYSFIADMKFNLIKAKEIEWTLDNHPEIYELLR